MPLAAGHDRAVVKAGPVSVDVEFTDAAIVVVDNVTLAVDNEGELAVGEDFVVADMPVSAEVLVVVEGTDDAVEDKRRVCVGLLTS